MIDHENRGKYKPYIEVCYKLAHKHLWNEALHYTNVTFDRYFKHQGDASVLPGHSFQLGWFFKMSQAFDFLEEQATYLDLGEHIIQETLSKSLFSKAYEVGFPETINPVTSEVVSDHRSWWEHAEWVNALCWINKPSLKDIKRALDYFESTFVDYKYGCEQANVDAKQEKIIGMKGELGKSSYHTIEMCGFVKSLILKQ